MGRETSSIELVKYIRATPEQVWRALTDPGQTRKYFMEHGAVASEFTPDADVEYTRENEAGESVALVRGRIVTYEPERELVYTFALADLDEPASRVSWTIAPFGGSRVKLGFAHRDVPPATHARMKNTWGVTLTRLQTLLENGATGWQ